MRKSITISLCALIFCINNMHAQQVDSTKHLPVMKKKFQIFIAEIETELGKQKGIFYRADSNVVVILDSLFRPITIAVKEIKTLDLRRSNAYGFSFGIGFGATVGLSAGIAILVAADGLGKYALASFLIGIPLALLVGGAAVLMATAPNIRIRNDLKETLYLRSLKYLRERSQENLLKVEARKNRNYYR
jgi:hypothetical protein